MIETKEDKTLEDRDRYWTRGKVGKSTTGVKDDLK